MKQFIMIILILVMIASIPLKTFAEKKDVAVMGMNDSLKINSEVKHQLGVQDSENVIKIYNLSMSMAFSKVQNIEELLQTEGLILSEYYAVQKNDGTFSYRSIVEDRVDICTDAPVNIAALKVLCDKTIENKIAFDIKGVYYLSGETTYTGSAIYYQTNQGDYVYYRHYLLGNGEYLLPIKDFCEFQSAIQSEIDKQPNLDGDIDISRVYDLSKYEIHSADIVANPKQTNDFQNIIKWVSIFAGIAFLSVFIIVGVHKRMLSKKSL